MWGVLTGCAALEMFPRLGALPLHGHLQYVAGPDNECVKQVGSTAAVAAGASMRAVRYSRCWLCVAVEALIAVASRPVGVTHIWALHGLWLVAGAAGVGYAAHVKQSLQLSLELLVSARAAIITHTHTHITTLV